MLHFHFASLEICPPIRAHYLFLFADPPVLLWKVSFFPVLLCLFLRDTETKWQLQIDNRVWVQKKEVSECIERGFPFGMFSLFCLCIYARFPCHTSFSQSLLFIQFSPFY